MRTSFTDCITGRLFEQQCDHLAQGNNAAELCRDAGAPSRAKMVVSNSSEFQQAEETAIRRSQSPRDDQHQQDVSSPSSPKQNASSASSQKFKNFEDAKIVQARLTKFYQEYQPKQVPKIPTIMRVFYGREEKMWDNLKLKYEIDDETFNTKYDVVASDNDDSGSAVGLQKQQSFSTTTGEKANAKFDTEIDRVNTIRKHMTLIYKKHAPEKLSNIEAILLKYRGHEGDVFAASKIKYNVSEEEMQELIARDRAEKEQESQKETDVKDVKDNNDDDQQQTTEQNTKEKETEIAPPPPLLLHINNPTESERIALRARCARVITKYMCHNNKNKVDEVLKKYNGKEEFLLPALVKKYCPDGKEPEMSEEEMAKMNPGKEQQDLEQEQVEKENTTTPPTAQTPTAQTPNSAENNDDDDLGSLGELDLDEEDIRAIPKAPSASSCSKKKKIMTPRKPTPRKEKKEKEEKTQDDDDDDLGSLDLDVDEDEEMDLDDLDLDVDDDDDGVGSLGDLDLNDFDDDNDDAGIKEEFSLTV